MPPAPTIRSLAAGLGLSRTTVSDALRGSSRVKGDTAKQVWKAAAAAGYRPNPLAGAIMSEIRRSRAQTFRGGLAAIDLDDFERPASTSRYHESLVDGARRRAAELGYKLQNFVVGRKGLELSRVDTILKSRGIQGVLVLPAWREPDLSRLDWSRYAGIYADTIVGSPALYGVSCDHFRSMMEVLERLGRIGYRRPGLFLHRHLDERIQHRWEGAFLAFSRSRPLSARVPPLLMDRYSQPEFARWLRRYKPDVVVGHPEAAIDWMDQCGFRVPERAGFFCLNLTQAHTKNCTGLDLQPRLLGARAVELLIVQLQRNERGIPEHASTTMIPANWVDGSTLQARP